MPAPLRLPACFAALLDTEAAGRWLLVPASGGRCTSRRHRGDTLVLETEWVTPDGTVRVVDLMPLRGRYPDVVRVVEGVSGEVAVRGELTIRFDHGRVVPWVRRHGARLQALAGPDALWLSTPAPVEGRDRSTVSEFTVRAGDRVRFVLTWTPGHHDAPPEVDAERALAQTVAAWETWVGAGERAGGRWADAVTRSLITLRALNHAPTGGIVAAVTTSLPEQPGGPRNWDYRYSWLRDSTYTLWEQRGEPRHFVHSKVMAWVAFDRMVRGAREHRVPGPVEHWEQVRDTIHAQVIATVEAVERELTRDGLVLRYRPESSGDGLPGTEGVFLACSFWLVDALAGIGRRDDAEALFERLLGCASDLGLLSEEWDPDAGPSSATPRRRSATSGW